MEIFLNIEEIIVPNPGIAICLPFLVSLLKLALFGFVLNNSS
jgi:hypothetical protein